MHAPEFEARTPPGSTFGTVIYVLSGPLLWSLHLALVYVGHEIWCAPHVAPASAITGVPVFVVITTAACGGLIAWILLRPVYFARVLRSDQYPDAVATFLRGLMRGLAGLALAGILWAASAIALLTPCQ